jgi:hypothetical protein
MGIGALGGHLWVQYHDLKRKDIDKNSFKYENKFNLNINIYNFTKNQNIYIIFKKFSYVHLQI